MPHLGPASRPGRGADPLRACAFPPPDRPRAAPLAPAVRSGWFDGVVPASATDWAAWHDDYRDPASALSRRLRVVQDQIRDALPRHPREPVRVLSLCAGRAEDLIGVLRGYAYANLVKARLIERDARNVRAMAAAARLAGLRLEIVQGDAANPSLYAGRAPADLVLLCGVLGNISDADARRTVATLPALCRTGGTVVWTRSRRPPDLTPEIRRWFTEAGFAEWAFIAPESERFSVGAARFRGPPRALGFTHLFTFIR